MHQEGQVSRIPKQVRNMKMREFGGKYNGNVQAALRGFQKEKFVAAGGEGGLGELDKDARKRKWVASQEVDSGDGKDLDFSKAPKNGQTSQGLPLPTESDPLLARTTSSPKKIAGSSTGPGTAQRARLFPTGNKTPGTVCHEPPSALFCISLYTFSSHVQWDASPLLQALTNSSRRSTATLHILHINNDRFLVPLHLRNTQLRDQLLPLINAYPPAQLSTPLYLRKHLSTLEVTKMVYLPQHCACPGRTRTCSVSMVRH